MSVRNTTAQDSLINMMETMFEGGIERQEARGQQELVNSEVLPTDGLFRNKAEFEALGFVIGEVVQGDPIFTNVKLPAGWKKQATDHSMWSKLVDETGKERASIFYKAAFYDRSAHINLIKG